MSEPTSPTRRRRRRFRWYTRLAIVIACVVVVTIVIAQLLFWSDVPRRIVQAQIGNILHVQARLGALRIGWLGGVDVKDLSLQLPTEEQPFLTVDHAHLKLAPLFVIAFDQEVRDVQANGVDLAVRQHGNVLNVVQLFASGAERSTVPSEPTNPAKILAMLPSVRLTDTRVTVTNNDGRTLVLPDVRLTLDRTAPLTNAIEAHVGTAIALTGNVATLGTAPHELHVVIANPPPGLDAFLGAALPTPANATLSWTGRLTPGGITGTLTLDSVAVSVARVAGTIDVTAGGNDANVVVRPTDLTLAVAPSTQPTQPTTQAVAQASLPVSDGASAQSAANRPTPTGMSVPLQSPATQPVQLAIHIASGAIVLDDQLHINGLRGSVSGGGTFAVDGHADLNTFAGEVNAAWDAVAQAAVTTTGHASLRTTPQFTGKLLVAAGVGASADVPGGAASGTVALSGEADTVGGFVGTLTVEPLTWTPTKGAPIVTPALLGDVSLRGTEVALRDLHSTDAAIGTLTASATIDRVSQAWWTTLDARGLKLPPVEAMGVTFPIDANVAMYGTRGDYAAIQHLYARSGPASAWATGAFEKDLPKPVHLETWAWLDRPSMDDNQAQLGSLVAFGLVQGTLAPRAIDADMQVNASQLVVHGRAVGDIALQIVATATEEQATVHSKEMDLLGGTWWLNGLWDKHATPTPIATLDFHRLPLARLGDVAKQSGLGGTIDEGHVVVRLDATALDKIDLTATATGSDLSYAPAGPRSATLTADTLALAASLHAGEFKAVPILRNGTGTLTAEVDGNVALKDPIRLGVTLTDWPAPEPTPTTLPTSGPTTEAVAATQPSRIIPRANAKVEVSVTLGGAGVPLRSALKMTAAVDRAGDPLADVSVDATADGPLLTLRDATIHTLDGVMNATGHVDVANLNAATLDARFERLAPSELAWAAPPLADVSGRFSGTATLGPASGPRPLGPLQFTLAVRPDAAHFRSVDIGNLDLVAFGDFTSADKFRVVTDTATLHVADGTVMPFARFSYDASVGPSQLVTVTFERLDIGQLVKAVDDDGKDLSGRAAGTIRVYGPARTLGSINGEATATITESDLANFGPVAALYNVMNIGTAGKQPNGTGGVSAGLQEGLLTITDATYFNRGVYATAFGTVKRIDELPYSPLDLTVLGSLQPFRSSKPSIFADIFNTANDTFAALQTTLTAVHAGGTLKDPVVGQVGLNALSGDLKALVMGKVKE